MYFHQNHLYYWQFHLLQQILCYMYMNYSYQVILAELLKVVHLHHHHLEVHLHHHLHLLLM
jgi:hypothetical protein